MTAPKNKGPVSFQPKNRKHLREWLKKNHAKEDAVWLIYHKKSSATPSLDWDEAVEEALCFGWIDSKRQKVDASTFRQFFGKRKPHGTWSKINKARIQRLTEEGLMTKAGLDAIDHAKRNGSWTILDEVEELTIPDDLGKALKKVRGAFGFFSGLTRSSKRMLLQWLVLAKREETRNKRIKEIVTMAGKGLKPMQFR